jgi:ABC-type Fe3+/spermidine/putrescine transport system ATPase subunit
VSASRPVLKVEALSSAWAGTPVLRSVSLEVVDREYFVLLGPNGSGKTTLLRLLAGLEAPTAGRVELDGVDLAGRPPHRRGIGLMFQDPALFPHRSVYENIAYAPLLQRRPTRELAEGVGRLLSLLRLEGFEDRAPDSLSGGERQRVALARTLAARPRLVLLDEPFASIDVELKASLEAEFRGVLRTLGTAAIHVTHDREEGMFLADRMGLLFDGRLEAVGSAEEVYGTPRSARAAKFLGYNVLRRESGFEAVHPNDLRVGPAGPGLPVEVTAVGPAGRDWVAILTAPGGERFEARWSGDRSPLRPGERGFARWDRSVAIASDDRD